MFLWMHEKELGGKRWAAEDGGFEFFDHHLIFGGTHGSKKSSMDPRRSRKTPIFQGAAKISIILVRPELSMKNLKIFCGGESRRSMSYQMYNRVEDLCGLALSGGGIRSGEFFSLGLCRPLLIIAGSREFDYLSSVSGGGYIGCGLSWTINQDPTNFGLSADTFPYASFPYER